MARNLQAWCAGVMIFLLLAIVPPLEQQDNRPAEEAYKNVQVFRGMPAWRLDLVMKNLNRWLGVECVHCHVDGQWEKEDKPPFATTRKMFRLVRQVKQDFLEKEQNVSCWTCHRGKSKPEFLPPERP
jgi:hypothetical protein